MASRDPYAAFRISSFRWFIASLITQTLGTQIQGVVVGWQVYAFTHDALSLGLIGLAEAVPFIAMALYAGHVADRLNRRRVTAAALTVLFACSLALLLLTATGSIATGRVWPVYLVIGVSGLARSFLQPARTALAGEIVSRDLQINAVGWRSAGWQGAAVAGPAMGGLLYGLSGPLLSYAVDASLMALGVACLLGVRSGTRVPAPAADSLAESLAEGLRFVRGQRILLGAITLDLFAVLFGGAVALLPIFAAEILQVGPEGLGLLRAAPAAGAVLMSLYISHRGPFAHAGRSLLAAVAVFGLCMIGFGVSRSFPLSVLLLGASGMADNISVILRSSVLQMMVPEHLLGRVSAVNYIFIGSSNEIGAFESGVAARLLGTVPSVVFGGLMTLGVVGATAAWVPELRDLERIE
jgi:MFS family permease